MMESPQNPKPAQQPLLTESQDLSNRVKKSSGNLTLPGGWILHKNEALPEVSNKDLFANKARLNKGPLPWTRFEVPEARLNLTNYDGKSKCGSGNDNCPDTYLSANFTTNPGRTINFRNHSILILAIQYLEADDRWRENKTIWQETPVTAEECGLYFCVNEYETSLKQGILKEKVVKSWTNKTINSYNSHPDDDWRGTENFIYPSFGLNRPPAFVLGLGDAGDVPASVEEVASSLTKWMRDRELAPSPVRSEATVMTVITRVRWEFLIFPAVMHLLELAFVVVSIWETNALKRLA
ncbi:hypothetical protein ACHAPT_007090 [Fusarium lateritium]